MFLRESWRFLFLAAGPSNSEGFLLERCVLSPSSSTIARPRMRKHSAARITPGIWLSRTLTSPMYMKSRRASSSLHVMLFMTTTGFTQGVHSKMALKYSLHVDSTNLWTVKNLPSHANVASV